MTEKEKTEGEISAQALREKGNECIKDGNYKEAALFYTEAIKYDPENYPLYSNRSLAYLKLKHYSLSFADANEAIRLCPTWAKGYFRRAEVETAVGQYDEALLSYAKALQLLPEDPGLFEALKKVTQCKKSKNEFDEKIPWVCSCVGLVLGVFLIIIFYILYGQALSNNPLLQVCFILAVASCGWGAGRIFIIIQQKHIENFLIPVEVTAEAAEGLPIKYFLYGLVVGVTVISLDYFFNIFGFVDTIWRMLFTIFACLVGWLVGSIMRYKELKNIPDEICNDLLEETTVQAEVIIPERTSNKYTKAQARHRYKKGKNM